MKQQLKEILEFAEKNNLTDDQLKDIVAILLNIKIQQLPLMRFMNIPSDIVSTPLQQPNIWNPPGSTVIW